MDRLIAGHDAGEEPAALTADTGLDAEQVAVGFREIARRRAATRYLHAPAVVIEP